MSSGKIASQAGHAYLGCFLTAQQSKLVVANQYAAEQPGTKICLRASEFELHKAHHQALELGLPCFLVVDSGCVNFFNGEPVVTALGIGPCRRYQIESITKKLKLL